MHGRAVATCLALPGEGWDANELDAEGANKQCIEYSKKNNVLNDAGVKM
jgi:hypothetical protein